MSNRQTLIARSIASGVPLIELARAEAKVRNSDLMADARARLDSIRERNLKMRGKGGGSLRRKECAPNRKAHARLIARQKDYAGFIGLSTYRGNVGEHHKPGSMQGPR